MVLLGDEAEVEAHFDPFGDCANLVQIVACLRRTYPRLGNHFGRAQWNCYVTWVMSNLDLIHLETVLVSMQDRGMVCARRTIGLEIILDALDGTTM